MRRSASHVLFCAAFLFLAGCMLRGNRTATKVPPAPAPPAASHAPAPSEPLSVPQTQVQLPPPQPLSQDALATEPAPPVVELPEEPAQRPPRRPPAANPPTVSRQEPAAPAPIQGPVPPEPERPIVQEKISPEEQKRLIEQLAGRKREIAQNVDQAAARGPGAAERALMDRIHSFVQLADEAAGRGDLRQADALAERAQILSRELQGAR